MRKTSKQKKWGELLTSSPHEVLAVPESYVVVALVTLFKRFNWFTIVENDCEIADVSVPEAKLNTTATRSATNARIAPYSVIPCPDSSDMKFLSEVVKFIYLPPRGSETS